LIKVIGCNAFKIVDLIKKKRREEHREKWAAGITDGIWRVA